MKKKGKKKQQILFEEKTKPFLSDYSVQVQDEIEGKKIKEGIRKIADAAEQRIKKLNAELNFVKGQLRQEIEKRGDGVFSDDKWLHHSFEFLKGHHFFTSYAKEKYGIQKNINLTKIAKQLESIKEKKEKVEVED